MPAQPMEHILVPVDGSENATRAAALAGHLAASVGARVTLLHVLNLEAFPLVGAPAISREEMQSTLERVSNDAFEAARTALTESGVEPTREMRTGRPTVEILDFIRTKGVDLVVMGSRGLSPIKELLLGSVSSQLLHHAPCAVTVVR